ncbi:hypothetical protein [Deinococcus arcticus]|uniref:Uncharacterized protein n=1 Tax=Deinococcus arcticus TaxID=2136176 RepID=A0A2T3W899_9DEIO|nr:hypothetical protein [Deinococcus arcticus]PTA68024.1 hypothetical protein C8263_09900 [Deinococcus arcticus]
MTRRAVLARRNALWRQLRALPPGPEFEQTLAELSALTGWDRARILAGLGLTAEEALHER